MRDDLLPYYERELSFIRRMAGEFAEKYPKVAGRLRLEPNQCEDPHVERLIEAFALLAGRVHHKLDDEFPEITEALLDALCPHYLRPVPSQAIAQFQLDTSQSAAACTQVPAGVSVHSRPEGGQFCSFRTCYPVTLWPLRVTGASVSAANRLGSASNGDSAAVVRIQMECTGGLRLSQLPVDTIRFYLDGESALVHALYESLFMYAQRVGLRGLPSGEGSAQAVLPATCLRQAGFSRNEAVLPYSDRSFAGYRILQEYFTFPEKFLFVDVTGLGNLAKADFGAAFEILVWLKHPGAARLPVMEQGVGRETFQSGCTPIVNLFERIAEPIRLTHAKTEYRVIGDQHRQQNTEIYSVDRVASATPYLEEPRVFEPFYAMGHGRRDEPGRRFWSAHRRPSPRPGGSGTEVYLTLVDLNFEPAAAADETLTLRVTCTNRDQAARLRFSGEYGELEAEGLALVRARCIRRPTVTGRPPLRRGLEWRLISHLSLNYLSIVENGREALQEILQLYNFSDDASLRKQIAGISGVSSRSSVARVVSDTGVTFCRGTDVTINFDEDQYVGSGVFLLGSVLHRFLGLYSAVNSFSRLTMETNKGVFKQWPPLAGEQVLL
jgi:type VI secretion system protein ImpG